MAEHELAVGSVRLAWDAAAGVAHMRFDGGASPGQDEARACIDALAGWTQGGPVRLLVDCAGLQDTRPGWRATFADAAAASGGAMRFAWYHADPVLFVTVDMFLRASRMDGRIFPDEASARAWLATGDAANARQEATRRASEPTTDDLLDGLARASIGRLDARVRVPPPQEGDAMADTRRLALAINILLSDLGYREERLRGALEALRSANATLEARVAERTRALERTNEELRAFNAMVAHDLRAPLRAIEHLTTIIVEDHGQRLGSDGAPLLTSVHQSARRMSILVEDLLAFARAGQADVQRQPVDLSALAEDVLAELREGDPDRVVETVVKPGLHVVSDPRLLRLALANLLGNAWKFTRRTARARIEVGEARSDDPAQRLVYVRDNGAGFDPAAADRLFVPFRRLHGGSEYEGTGLGLATVQRLVERHGGRVWAEGAPGRGATLYLTLPAQRPPAER